MTIHDGGAGDLYSAAREREAAFLAACQESRERRGWSQRELSRRLNLFGLHLAQSSIGKMEGIGDGRRPVTLAEAVVLAHVLDVDLLQFVGPAVPADARQDALWDYVIDMDRLIEIFADRQNELHRAFFNAPGRIGLWAHGRLEAGEHPLTPDGNGPECGAEPTDG